MIPKPGKKIKHKPKQKPPADRYCRNCGRDDGCCAWRHDESRLGKMKYGGGIIGGKLPDSRTAFLCMHCDSELSRPLPRDATQKELKNHEKEWDRLIELSH